MDKIFLLLLVASIWSQCSSVRKPTHCNLYKDRKCPDMIVVKIGSNVTLKCPLNGISYDFYRENRQIVSDNNKYNVSGNTLTITKVVYIDNGHYTCEAKNQSGNVTKYYWVVFAVKHVRPKPRPATELPVGSKKVFNCTRPNYIMYSVSDDVSKAQVFPGGNRLQSSNGISQNILNLRTVDSGYYYCGQQTTTGLRVWKRFGKLIVRDLPRISRRSKSKLVTEGRTTGLLCKFSGPEEIAWYKNGKKLIASLSQKKNKKLLKLTLRNVTETDAGDYYCRVTIGGITVNQTAHLDVFAFQHAAVLAMGPLPKHSSVTINCQSNILYADYSLLHKKGNAKDSTTIKIDKTKYIAYQEKPGLFLIVNLNKQDEGQYTCQAKWLDKVIRKTAGDVVLM